MKKFLPLLLFLAMLPFLAGCESDLFASRRDMERLRPIQTIGIDRDGSAVTVSISTGIGPDKAPPLVMTATASSIETAIARLQDYSPEDELFYAHIQYILIGDSDASILPILDWVERSPAMRIDTPVFIVRGSAAEAVAAATGQSTDITERLASLEREEAARGCHIYTLREIATALTERGSAICLTVQSSPSDGVMHTESEISNAVLPAGYTVLRDGQLAEYLTQNETMGVEILDGGVNGAQVEIDDTVLELLEAGAEVIGQWDDTSPAGILIRCRLRAGILEQEDETARDPEAMRARLTSAAEGWLTEAVTRSQLLGTDFLDLRSAVMKNAPRGADTNAWAERFGSLPVTVRAEAEIDRGYDLTE